MVVSWTRKASLIYPNGKVQFHVVAWKKSLMVWFRNGFCFFFLFYSVFLCFTGCRNSKINNFNHILFRTTITSMTKAIAIEKKFLIFLWLVFFFVGSCEINWIVILFFSGMFVMDLEVWRTFHFNLIVWNRMKRICWFFGNIPKRLYCYSVASKLDYEIESHSSAFLCLFFFYLSTCTHIYENLLLLYSMVKLIFHDL